MKKLILKEVKNIIHQKRSKKDQNYLNEKKKIKSKKKKKLN